MHAHAACDSQASVAGGARCLTGAGADAQVKTKGARKATFPEFQTALEAVAAKKVRAN